MRRFFGILVCLFWVANMFATTYQSYQPTDFRSTSAYVTSRPDGISTYQSQAVSHQSIASISASNFAAMNEEGGEFYQPPATNPHVRKGRPGGGGGDSGGGAIGEYDFHSPIGATPWLLFAVMVTSYILIKRRRNRMNRTNS